MNKADKVKKTEALVLRLKAVAAKAMERKEFNKALSALSACANVLYEYNQRYKDDDIENMLLEIGNELIAVPEDFCPKEVHPVQTVLFYDGFGLDLRGLAANMTKNIASLGYRLIYVTDTGAGNSQPGIHRALHGLPVEYVYIDMRSDYVKWARELNQVFIKYAPQAAFFYTVPNDVSGAVVFNRYKDRVTRYLVNLTDHAFWIGLNAFDFCSTSRAMGTWINLKGRGIPLDKIYRNRSNVFVDERIPPGAMPFDTGKYRYVFSGGFLYKTLGDPDNYFYRMIEHIVSNYPDVNFLYAGEGDGREFEKLMNKYPERVFLIHEREDFYQIIRGAVFYLNTYPMFGGQMMRYAAYAGKIPVTLKHNDDGQGILFHQEELGIEFDTYAETIAEIDKILKDEEYRKQKEKTLAKAVVSAQEARDNLKKLIEDRTSPLPVDVEEYDTEKFRKEYIERLDYDKLEEESIARKINLPLLSVFPGVFCKRAWKKAKKKLCVKKN